MKEKLQSMLSRELIMKIALMVFGAIAGIAGYEVVQDEDSVTIEMPAEQPAEEQLAEDAKPPEQPADQPAEEK